MDDTFLPFFLHHVALPRFHQHKMQGKLPGVEVRDTGFYATEGRDGCAPCSVKVADLGATCGGCVELGNMSRWSEASLLETMCRTSCQPGESIMSLQAADGQRPGSAKRRGGHGGRGRRRSSTITGEGQARRQHPHHLPIPGCSTALWRFGLLCHVLVHHRFLPSECVEVLPLWNGQGFATVRELNGLLSTPRSRPAHFRVWWKLWEGI